MREITGEQPSGLELEEFYEGDDPRQVNDEENISDELALLIEEDMSSEEEDLFSSDTDDEGDGADHVGIHCCSCCYSLMFFVPFHATALNCRT